MSVTKMCPHVDKIMNKIRLDQLSKASEETKGGSPRRVRGPWGVVRGG